MRTRLVSVTIALVAILAISAWIAKEHHGPVYIVKRQSKLFASRTANGTPEPLFAGFAAERGAESSFDGSRILFAARMTPTGRWQVFESSAGGSGTVQLTKIDADCDEPHYLPDGGIVFRRTSAGQSVLCTMDDDGGKVTQITFNRDPIRDTLILPDGRILATLGQSRVTINVDGTGVAAFTGIDDDVAAARAQIAEYLAPVRPRPIPTGHVSVIDPKKRPGGLLFCANSYLSDRPGIDALPDGSIARVRIWTADPDPRIAAEAPVESDGSFFLKTPANTPMRFQTLDKSGRVLGDQTTWIWLRPNESRGCIGCHESPGLTPQNQVVAATRKPPVEVPARPASTQQAAR